MPQIDIVLPCLNEAAALPWVLERIPRNCRAIVVDNGSEDGSPAIAVQRGALVVACPTRGYGSACQAGLDAASAEFVAFCDCDATIDPGAVTAAIALLSQAELVLGRRRPVSRAAWPITARVANSVLARRVSRRTGTTISDVGPLRVARTESLRTLGVRDPRGGYPLETVVRAAEAGWRIAQLDVDYLPRLGRSKVTGTVGGYVRTVREMSAVLAS